MNSSQHSVYCSSSRAIPALLYFVLDLCFSFFTCDFQPYCSINWHLSVLSTISWHRFDAFTHGIRFVFLFFFSLLIPVFLSSLFSFLPFRSHSLFIFFEISKLTFCTFCRLIYVFKMINKRNDQQIIFFRFLCFLQFLFPLNFDWFQKWN